MIYFPDQARVVEEERPEGTILFQGFPKGENTSVPPAQLSTQELAECINFKIFSNGQLKTRDAFLAKTTTPIGAVQVISHCSLKGEYYTLCADSNKLYYLLNDTPVEIAMVPNIQGIIAYNDVAVILDTSYLKYCDALSEVKLAYDAGTGGTFFDNYAGVSDTVLSASKAGAKITTPKWDAGYTIPPTGVYFRAYVSTGEQPVTVKIYKADGITAIAEKLCDFKLNTTEDFLSVSFFEEDITEELQPETEYYVSIEAVDLQLAATIVSSGGHGCTNSGSWVLDTTKEPIIRFHPGLPPKASMGCVSGNRLMITGPGELGRVYFGNLTHLDWSTPNGGGWVGVIDDGANSFEIGGLQDLYGDLYVYGTQETPYLCQLIGDTPDTYSLPVLFQRIWATQKTLVNTNNDIWNASADGVDAITGVQEYGDLRTFSASDTISDRFKYWNSDTAIAGYHAKDGQYWLFMPGYEYISIAHTKLSITEDNDKVIYPWTRYSLPNDIIPSCFNQAGEDFLIGAENGLIYTINNSDYRDLNDIQIDSRCRTSYIEIPGRSIDLIRAQVLATSEYGGLFDVLFYTNGYVEQTSATYTKRVKLALLNSITLNDLYGVLIEDLYELPISTRGTLPFFDLNINCYSLQLEISNMLLTGSPVYINGVLLSYRELEG